MNRLFQNNKWLNLSYIIFIENFKIMKNSVLPLNEKSNPPAMLGRME